METLECIKSRRSRRRFLDRQVPADMIEKIIEAGKCAPSSHNCQPWQFYIIKDKEAKAELAQNNHEDNRAMILACNFVLLICVDLEKSPVRFLEDGILAAHNMALAIHDLELGCVYSSAYKIGDKSMAKRLKEFLNIAGALKPISLLCVGYPDPAEDLENKNLRDNKTLIEYR